MALFFAYLKERLRVLSAFVLFFLIFLVTFALYRLPLPAVVYPTGLCLLLGLALLVWDYRKVLQKHRLLEKFTGFTDCLTNPLPPQDCLWEADYQAIVRLLCQEHQAMATRQDLRYQDMTDYYTAWAHQIKTPIASLRLHLQDEDTPLARQLSSDVLRIEQYVEMVLMFLRLDGHTTDFVIRESDLDSIVKEAVKKFSGEFIVRKLRLCYEPLNFRVLTDEKWLSFVVEQVLSNALKYTPAGSVTITLEDGGVLCVRDTGMGIAPEDLPRIFENGYTGFNGRADKRASGIGLYLCRKVCKHLGHGITADSQVGRGTVIRIDLRRENRIME